MADGTAKARFAKLKSWPKLMRTLPPLVKAARTPLIRELPRERDGFYNSAEYKAWAQLVKQRAGWRCEVVEDGVRCPVAAPHRLYAHHIKDRKAGGADLDPANGECRCHAHHERTRGPERANSFRG
jgi:5-methylcytosine-specific restriction enzyme A